MSATMTTTYEEENKKLKKIATIQINSFSKERIGKEVKEQFARLEREKALKLKNSAKLQKSYRQKLEILQNAILEAFIPNDDPKALIDYLIFLKMKHPQLAIQLLTRLLPKQISLDVQDVGDKKAPIVIMGDLNLQQNLNQIRNEIEAGVELLESK